MIFSDVLLSSYERYLAKAAGADVELPPFPTSRREQYWAAIVLGTTDGIPAAPTSNEERYLAAIAHGSSTGIPAAPTSRKEQYLAAIALGTDDGIPDFPTSREEYFLAAILGSGGGTIQTITGVSPLTLASSLAKPIRNLTQYGKCVQDETPTPDAPVDIMCNNGALKMVHRSGLPSGYKLLEYVGGSGTQYVITDVYLASTDVIECEYRNSSATGFGAVYGIFKTGESSALYGNQTYYGYDVSNNKVDTGMAVDTDWHSSRHDFANGTLTIDDTTVSFTPFEFVNSKKNAVLSRYYNGSYGYNWKGYVRKFKVMRGNEVVCDLLPAKNASDVAGLYDLVSGTFYTATGGALLEGNEVDDYELSVVGTPEVLTVSADGAATQTVTNLPMLLSVGNFKDELDIVGGIKTGKIGIKVFDGTESFGMSSAYGAAFYIQSAASAWGAQKAIVMSSHYLGLATASSVAAEDTCFFNASGHFYFRVADNSDTAAFKAWLAAQYAAGTPVIVIYPLAEETAEQTTPHSLRSYEGTTIVEADTNVDPVTLSAEYAASEEDET